MSDQSETVPIDEDVTGYLKTSWDCPWCQYDGETDGDATGEELVCPDCGNSFRIGTVR